MSDSGSYDEPGIELLATLYGNGVLGGSGSGVDIFIEAGDCDLEFGSDAGCELNAKAFLIADGPSGIDD